jgi:hypothetical protein
LLTARVRAPAASTGESSQSVGSQPNVPHIATHTPLPPLLSSRKEQGAALFRITSPTRSSLLAAAVLRAARQWRELPVAHACGRPAASGSRLPAAAGRRCGREPGWRRRTRCCWSTSACTGPATGAPFDPKASCRAPASPAASAGSTSSDRTSSRKRDPCPCFDFSSGLLC